MANIPKTVQRMFVSLEDSNFYAHNGIDWVAIKRAYEINKRVGEYMVGGSTITQQLARQSFLNPDKTMRRKFQELILAARIERYGG